MCRSCRDASADAQMTLRVRFTIYIYIYIFKGLRPTAGQGRQVREAAVVVRRSEAPVQRASQKRRTGGWKVSPKMSQEWADIAPR